MISEPLVSQTNPSLQLGQLINPNSMRAGISVRDWQEAIQAAGQLLVENHTVEPRYVSAMERVLRELGPYAVLAPGIVLLHARPEDGVLEPCLAILTLTTPVCFGHSENDPVDIVLALGAIDKSSHIQALSQLADLLGDPAALSRLRSARDDQELLSVIVSWTSSPPAEE